MRANAALATLLALGQIVFACSSTSEESPGPPSGGDGDASDGSSPVDAGSDVDGADTVRPDATVPKPLEIVCKGEPCYRAISGMGGNHLCALREDKTVLCWGRDSKETFQQDGALGRGVAVSSLEGATPRPVVGLPPVDRVRVGPNYGTCARTPEGQVYCWGRNDLGQLGQRPEQAQILTPTRVEGLPPVDEIELGQANGCAITTGERALYCWGTDTTMEFSPPHRLTGFRPPVKALAIGTWEEADCIVAHLEGDVLAATGWATPAGDSHFPSDSVLRSGVTRIAPLAFGAGDGTFRRWLPIEATFYFPVASPVADLKLVGRRFDFSMPPEQGAAVTGTGRLFRWGANTYGALGVHPSKVFRSQYPVEVQQVKNEVAAFATTFGSTCALLADGKIKCWGGNAFGELGRGSIDEDPHPEPEFIR